MLVRRYQWMGMISAVLTLLLLPDSLIVHATENGSLVGEGTTETVEQYEVNDDEIWALIDREELRSLIDADALKDSIDLDSLRIKVDKEPLLDQISEIKLLESMSTEEIMSDFNSLKDSGQLDDYIREVIESDGFDEEYVKNKPIAIPDVKIPITDGNSPLDYIVDPMGLIYQTEAINYDGGRVQEGANVLFRNSEGNYLFSDTSDMLKIVNKGTVPLQVTISTRIESSEEVKLVDSSSMLEGITPSLFMTLVGENGLLAVLSDSGESEITIVLDAVPDGTYTYRRDDETGEYVSEMSDNADESKFASFAFGLKGECNTDANWTKVNSLPKVLVTWHTEPILTGWDEITKELDESDKVRFEAYRKAKLEELREEELERLIRIQIDEMLYEELDRLIDDEVEMLAQTRFDELKELAIKGELDFETGKPLDSEGMLILDEDKESNGDAAAADDQNTAVIEDSNESGTDLDARADSYGEVLGAKREGVEFVESEEPEASQADSDTIVDSDGEKVEFFNSESVEQNTSGAAEENISDAGAGSTDEPVLFINEEDSAGETIIF